MSEETGFEKLRKAIKNLANIDLDTVTHEPTRNLVLDMRALLKRQEDIDNGTLARPIDRPEVHILFEGRSLCMMDGVPGEWPPGHLWVGIGVKEMKDANCRLCISHSKVLELTESWRSAEGYQ